MSHLLWAFTHLIEALAFHSVVTYSTTDSDKTNLELRVEKIQNFDISDLSQLTEFVSKLEELTRLVDKVMPISGDCSEKYPQSQMIALVNDLLSVSSAFSRINGIPDQMTDTLNQAIDDVKAAQEKASGAAAEQDKAAAFKADFTKQMSTIVAQKIAQADSSQISQEQKTSVCSSFKGINGGGGDSSQIPDLCKE